MRRSLPPLAALSVLLLVPTLTSPATAATGRSDDGRADVHHYEDGSRDEDGVLVARPTVDIKSFRVTYGASRIQVSIQYDDLRTKGFTHFYSALVVTYPRARGGRSYAELKVETTPSRRRGTSDLGGDDVRAGCATRHQIDYQRDTVVISAPSSCLGNPRYVDALVGTYEASSDYSESYVDIAPGDFATAEEQEPETIRVRRG